MTRRTLSRLAVSSVAASVGVGLATMAAPVQAKVPEGWSNPDPVDGMHVLIWMVGAPLALFALIVVLAMAPALVRGEKVLSAGQTDEWFGGPRQGTAELPAPDNEESKAGGASGSW